METLHLMNTIRFSLRKIVDIVPAEEVKPSNPYKDALYGVVALKPEVIAGLVNDALEGLAPYIFEAFFRSNETGTDFEKVIQVRNECLALLETILGRRTKLENYKPTDRLSLPSGMYDGNHAISENEWDELYGQTMADMCEPDQDEGDR
jgi:hypothetical protein